jgi:hypothetical protein
LHHIHIIPLMMEMVSETLGFYPQLTWLAAREDFIEFSCRESFKSYNIFLKFAVNISIHI